ncbi:hypothetical protein [Bartonella rattimassiliensis]|uniref:Uncharacterized protein n=1 Tax=Bartonella rattimassiliensis 15908 TaxID=1094556 RepID=J1JNP8_9HYPH|nr:hypothetical protein [Bartonella rattimassiliensis]EJF85915.1 hypothetical protein MCY_00929 [Bartonella rattimassiliensis 15908]
MGELQGFQDHFGLEVAVMIDENSMISYHHLDHVRQSTYRCKIVCSASAMVNKIMQILKNFINTVQKMAEYYAAN